MASLNKIVKGVLNSLPDGIGYVDKNMNVLYWNKTAEKLTGIRRMQILGRKIKIFSKDSCPVTKTFAEGSKNTAEMNVNRRGEKIQLMFKTSPFFSNEGDVVGTTISISDNTQQLQLAKKIKELEEIASMDYLTKLNNRRVIENEIQKRLDELNRYGKKFGILFFDIDHFKKINDTYGHDVGDAILKMIAKKLSINLRPFDFLGRWGGEEFIAVITNVTRNQLFMIASRIRKNVENSPLFTGEAVIRATLSIGAAISDTNDTIDTLIKRADEMLYKSKEMGRNRVSIESPRNPSSKSN
jgi:diguanylate cyclase (GGDEF)-like protein/PAS domain S-box-containing protein